MGSHDLGSVGRAVAALVADPDIAAKSGGVYSSWGLSDEFGFADIDGNRPHMGRYFAENFPQYVSKTTRTGRAWEITSAPTGKHVTEMLEEAGIEAPVA